MVRTKNEKTARPIGETVDVKISFEAAVNVRRAF
jgi:hypothetical protein